MKKRKATTSLTTPFKKKCIVLFSGGLDSRLAIKIMQEKGFDVLAVFFKLPFGCSCFSDVEKFLKQNKVKLKLFDCTKGKLLQEYLQVVKKAKHGTGAGVNPCIDCKIFMLKKSKEFADKEKISFIVTGEVVGQRPMSQQKRQMQVIEKEAGLKGRIIRPLIDFYNFQGRSRKPQMALAKEFKIKYPNPAGGCLLCEKALKNRLETLLNSGLNEKEIQLVGIGRHFIINGSWIIIGRNEEENKILESSKVGTMIAPNYPAPSAVIAGIKKYTPEKHMKIIKKVDELIQAYSKKGNLKERGKFDKYKL